MTDPLKSERLLYRALEVPEDVDLFCSMKTDIIASANASTALLRPVSRAQAEKLLKETPDTSLLTVVVCLRPSPTDSSGTNTESKASKPKPTPIGFIGIVAAGGEDLRHHRSGMIALEIHEDYRGKGYGTEAIEWVLEWGFKIAGLHRIAIGTLSYNTGAKKLYERMGFVYEGTQRERIWYNGGWHDIIEWSLLEHEWKARQEKKAGKGAMGDIEYRDH